MFSINHHGENLQHPEGPQTPDPRFTGMCSNAPFHYSTQRGLKPLTPDSQACALMHRSITAPRGASNP